MLNRLAKFLLISTSLSPVLGAVAVNQYSLDKPPSGWVPWLVAALLLIFICWGLLRYAARAAQKHTLKITQFEDKDKEVLAFLLAYLLPFAAAKDMLADVHWVTTVYVFAIIFLVFTHARAFHFNPMMGLLGYHFYSLKDGDGVSVLLISNTELRRAGGEVQTVRLAHDIYLQIGGTDA
jgi:hypothetical protein